MSSPNIPTDDETPTELLGATTDIRGGDSQARLQAGARIAAYVLKRPLGAGGMGDVWLAEQQQPVRRPVALKLLRRQISSPLSEAYFEVERQALARMDHPAIAKIFDAGRDAQGHPWFAMEWIDGQRLDSWCRERSPSLAIRLQLIAGLARGVQHAHQRGVLHRDLKPGNVLVVEVDGQPQPKLIDFGIALGLGSAPAAPGVSLSYDAAGTGSYMSPEQRAGSADSIDPRADVYALGMILLCVLLPEARLSALGPLVDSADALQDALRRAIKRDRGHPLLSALPQPLLHVLLRACAPQAAQRYASAEALAKELNRFLRDRPVQAVPASMRYRLRCFVRRHALATGAGLAILLALVGGLGAALYGLDRARDEAELSRAISDFMADVLTAVDPERAGELDRSLLRLILDDAALRAESALQQRPEALAEVEAVIGSTYVSLGEVERGVEFTGKALARADRALAEGDRSRLRVLRRHTDALIIAGKPAEAQSLLAAGLAAAGDDSDEPELLASLEVTQAWALRDQGKFSEALAVLEDALRRLPPSEDDPDPLQIRYIHAIVLSDLERFDEAEAEYLALNEALVKRFGAAHARTLRVLNSRGVLLLQQRRHADAVPVLRQALAGNETIFGPQHATTLSSASNLAGALRQSGQLEESGPYYRRALDGFVATRGERHPRAILALHNFGNYQLAHGEVEAALATQDRALVLASEELGAMHPVNPEIHASRGKALRALDRWAEAEAALLKALAGKREIYGERHRTIEDTEAELAALRAERAGKQ